MANLQALTDAINELNRTYPRPSLPPLVPSEPYDLENHWPAKYPSSDSPGVYVFVDESQTVAYVGKASCNNTIGKRLGDYIKKDQADGKPQFKSDKWADEKLRYIVTIGIESEHAFESGAIEEFLLYRLKPRLNRNGVGG